MQYSLSVFLVVGLATAANAQYSQGEKDSAFNEIRSLTEKWYKAAKERDSATLEKLLAPEFTLDGDVRRNVWLDRALHHINTDTLINVGPIFFEYYGGAVISKGNVRWKALYDGTYDLTGDYPFEDIWIRTGGQWRILIRMSDRASGK
jgi:Domain of unknown function (DUF4440)